jgi:hypothetical protein
MAQEWNVNIHYDARLAACVPARAAAVLDDIRELRQAAREVLPGARVRRLLFGRYLFTARLTRQ